MKKLIADWYCCYFELPQPKYATSLTPLIVRSHQWPNESYVYSTLTGRIAAIVTSLTEHYGALGDCPARATANLAKRSKQFAQMRLLLRTYLAIDLLVEPAAAQAVPLPGLEKLDQDDRLARMLLHPESEIVFWADDYLPKVCSSDRGPVLSYPYAEKLVPAGFEPVSLQLLNDGQGPLKGPGGQTLRKDQGQGGALMGNGVVTELRWVHQGKTRLVEAPERLQRRALHLLMYSGYLGLHVAPSFKVLIEEGLIERPRASARVELTLQLPVGFKDKVLPGVASSACHSL